MSFRESLIGQLQAVSKEYKVRQKNMKEVLEFLRLRADAEEEYGQMLERISIHQNNFIISNSPMDSLIGLLLEDSSHRCETSRNFAEYINSMIISPMEEILKNHSKIIKDLETQTKQVQKITSVSKKETEISYENYEKITTDIESTLQQYESNRKTCLLYTSPSPRDLSTSRMPSSA
eukprot:TRINITY_DN5503_c0_g1_i1.p1 TRINITY_DN5503_c0_g1~~TRINITY_DN5503_c0_g1_i1.p1  ORF type:complete len:189 (-),score=38.95 TRINITY_DN5503_c0_g1_i1:66-596(-)